MSQSILIFTYIHIFYLSSHHCLFVTLTFRLICFLHVSTSVAFGRIVLINSLLIRKRLCGLEDEEEMYRSVTHQVVLCPTATIVTAPAAKAHDGSREPPAAFCVSCTSSLPGFLIAIKEFCAGFSVVWSQGSSRTLREIGLLEVGLLKGLYSLS